MSNCNQCGASNPANATNCNFCQGLLININKKSSSGKIKRVYKKGDIKIQTCPECSLDFTYEYGNHYTRIQCPECDKDMHYQSGVVSKIVIGPKGEEYSKYENQSSNIERLCKDCLFYLTRRKWLVEKLRPNTENYMFYILFIIVPLVISIVPTFVWPQITWWYKWFSSALQLFAAYIICHCIYHANESYHSGGECKKLKNDCDYCNPNNRCKEWASKLK